MTPLCHRTIGPAMLTARDVYGGVLGRLITWESPPPRPCIGSRCSMWVPAEPGIGRCSESRRIVWPDPALPEVPMPGDLPPGGTP